MLAAGMCSREIEFAQLRDEIQFFKATAFVSAKIKIGSLPPAEDCKRIETAVGVLGNGDKLAVDAMNGYTSPGRKILRGCFCPTNCAGSRTSVIHWTTKRSRPYRQPMHHQYLQGKQSSRRPMRATSCATRDCVPAMTCSHSIPAHCYGIPPVCEDHRDI